MAAGNIFCCCSLGRTQAPMPEGLAGKPPMYSVPECRQTPGGLHPQRSKARGDTVPSEALLPWQAANMAAKCLPLKELSWSWYLFKAIKP